MFAELRQDDEKNLLEKGFTLVELLIVVVILGILAGIVVFAVGNLTSGASGKACSTEADTVATAYEAVRATTGVASTVSIPMTGANSLTTAGTLNGVAYEAPLKSTPKAWDLDTTAPFTLNTTGTFAYNPVGGAVTKATAGCS